jgi:hypothetical protein
MRDERLFDETLRTELGDAGVQGGAEEDGGPGGQRGVVPVDRPRRRHVRLRGAAVIGIGGAACAVLGGLLGGLGASTTVKPAAVHAVVTGKPATQALGAAFNGLPVLPSLLDRPSLVDDRLPLATFSTAVGPVAPEALATTPRAPLVTTPPTSPLPPSPAAPGSASGIPAHPEPSAPASPPPPLPVGGLIGIVVTAGNTVHSVVSEVTAGLPSSPGSAMVVGPGSRTCTLQSPMPGVVPTGSSSALGTATGGSAVSGSCSS